MSFSFFIAKRFFYNKSKKQRKRASAPAIHVATLGVAIGLAVMIVSVCVVKGFQNEVQEKITGFGSHIKVMDARSYQSPEDYPIVADADILQEIRKTAGIRSISPISQKMGVLKTNENFMGVELKGIDGNYDVSFLKKHLVEGVIPDFGDTTSTNKIVISQRIANDLDLKAGSRVFAYFFENQIKMRHFDIAGIYQTNLQQFDKLFVITDRKAVNTLNEWEDDQCSEIEIVCQDFQLMPIVQQHLANDFNGRTDRNQNMYSVISIKEDPKTVNTFQWLKLLDFNVVIILILMMLVAGFTMISGLLILILERTSTIGVLKALGASNTRIRHIFIYFATFVLGRGLLFGNLLGLGLIWAQKEYGLVRLDPATYYVDSAPILINWWWIIGINVATLLITVLALVLPSFMISRIQPAKAIRFE